MTIGLFEVINTSGILYIKANMVSVCLRICLQDVLRFNIMAKLAIVRNWDQAAVGNWDQVFFVTLQWGGGGVRPTGRVGFRNKGSMGRGLTLYLSNF